MIQVSATGICCDPCHCYPKLQVSSVINHNSIGVSVVSVMSVPAWHPGTYPQNVFLYFRKGNIEMLYISNNENKQIIILLAFSNFLGTSLTSKLTGPHTNPGICSQSVYFVYGESHQGPCWSFTYQLMTDQCKSAQLANWLIHWQFHGVPALFCDVNAKIIQNSV